MEGATDSVHRQSSGYPVCVREMWWFPFYEELHVGVPEACGRGAACASEGRVHVEAEGIANPSHPVYSASYLCDVHYDAVCSDRGQRLLFQTKGVN